MTIVCGVDLRENGSPAVRTAAALAQGLNLPLKLVHVLDQRNWDLIADEQPSIAGGRSKRVSDQATEIAARFGINVEPVTVFGVPYEKLIDVGRSSGAQLIVVASLSDIKQSGWLVGSVAERVAQISPIPVLVVRESTSIEAWARGERRLRIMVGADLASTSKAALHWAVELRAIGPCDIVVTQVAWPLAEHSRFGIASPVPLDHLRPELEELLMRDLRSWAGDLSGDGETTFTVSPGWGRTDAQLALLAAEAKADLLVVGTHQRAGSALFWQGSVSRGVLHKASCNVVCVPRAEIEDQDKGISTFSSVLIPTDFSALANRAIGAGYGLVAPGGVVHLLYVVTPRVEENFDPLEELRALIPFGAPAKGISTEVHVTSEHDPSTAISHMAGRLAVDAICMGTHGRSGLSEVLLGSQAAQVVKRAAKPVLLVPPEREN